MTDWNPRYIAYCDSLGLTPEQERASVAERFQGSTTMHEFIIWMSARQREFQKDRECIANEDPDQERFCFHMHIACDRGQNDWTAWLQERAIQLREGRPWTSISGSTPTC